MLVAEGLRKRYGRTQALDGLDLAIPDGETAAVVGTTGAGKSEFLRTLVLGLAMTHPPDQLNYVLVDFKGGATFLGLEEAPQVAAVITNLAEEAHMVERMRAEAHVGPGHGGGKTTETLEQARRAPIATSDHESSADRDPDSGRH